MISLPGKPAFFEKRVAGYQQASVISERTEHLFSLDEDF
jgi:hypothetical protein